MRSRSSIARQALWTTVLGLAATAEPATASPRFFASANQCESAHIMAPGACRTAFANAMAEFAAKAPSFPSRRACFRRFGPCMPWPIGTRRFDQFRPQWIGTTVDADVVLPAVAPGHLRLDFTPQSVATLSPAAAGALASRSKPDEAEVKIMTPGDDGAGEAAGPPPRAGSGFTMMDGVMTYPAPARFQPKNLMHP